MVFVSWKFFVKLLLLQNGLTYSCQIELRLKKIWISWIWGQSGICNSSRLEMRTIWKKTSKKKKTLTLNVYFSHINVMAKLFNLDLCNFYMKNWSVKALKIFFQNCSLFQKQNDIIFLCFIWYETPCKTIGWQNYSWLSSQNHVTHLGAISTTNYCKQFFCL